MNDTVGTITSAENSKSIDEHELHARPDAADAWNADTTGIDISVADGASAVMSGVSAVYMLDLNARRYDLVDTAEALGIIETIARSHDGSTALFFSARTKRGYGIPVAAKYIGLIPNGITRVLVLNNAFTCRERRKASAFIRRWWIPVVGISGTCQRTTAVQSDKQTNNGFAPDYCMLVEGRDYVQSGDYLVIPTTINLDIDLSAYAALQCINGVLDGIDTAVSTIVGRKQTLAKNWQYSDLVSFLSFGMLNDDTGTAIIQAVTGSRFRELQEISTPESIFWDKSWYDPATPETIRVRAATNDGFTSSLNKSVNYDIGSAQTRKIQVSTKFDGNTVSTEALKRYGVDKVLRHARTMCDIIGIWHDMLSDSGIQLVAGERLDANMITDIAQFVGVESQIRGLLSGIELQDMNDGNAVRWSYEAMYGIVSKTNPISRIVAGVLLGDGGLDEMIDGLDDNKQWSIDIRRAYDDVPIFTRLRSDLGLENGEAGSSNFVDDVMDDMSMIEESLNAAISGTR